MLDGSSITSGTAVSWRWRLRPRPARQVKANSSSTFDCRKSLFSVCQLIQLAELFTGSDPPAVSAFARHDMSWRRLMIPACLALMLVSQSAWAGTIFSRPLPTINLNFAAGANRSNRSFGESDPTAAMNGDDFTLPQSNGVVGWLIQSITV